MLLSDVYGPTRGAACDIEWVQSLLLTDSMIDAFAKARPYASDRFTCWNQYTNDRYSNIGSRIDYTFVDAALWDAFGCIGDELCGYTRDPEQVSREMRRDDSNRKPNESGSSLAKSRKVLIC